MSLIIPTNTVIVEDVPIDHPDDEVKIRFLKFSRNPIVIRDKLNFSKFYVCFENEQAATRAVKEPGLPYGPAMKYQKLVKERLKIDTSLPVPLNEKNWLISPPPSPPEDWQSTTEGVISKTLPFFDLPAPRLLSSENNTTNYIIYNPKEEGGKESSMVIPTIITTDFGTDTE